MIRFSHLAGLLCASCQSPMVLEYSFQLESPASSSLMYEDESLRFTFIPDVAGVAFAVENKSEGPAVIHWGTSFFVEPNGNTFAAINSEILDQSKTVSAASGASQSTYIPNGTTIRRYAASSRNISEHVTTLIESRSTWVEDIFAEFDGTREVHVGKSRSEVSTYEYWAAHPYWPTSILTVGNRAKTDLLDVGEKIRAGPSMTLGLDIECLGDRKEYRFVFAIQSVQALQSRRVGEERREVWTVTQRCESVTNYQWVTPEEESDAGPASEEEFSFGQTTLERPSNAAPYGL